MTSVQTVLGVDIGTSSSKGILVTLDGTVVGSATRNHEVSRPGRGQVEMDADLWWHEFADIAKELLTAWPSTVVSVGVSGMGPCVVLADEAGTALRPAILYGVDTRATEQIALLTHQLGNQAIVDRCGSALSSQAVGPKLLWLTENEPAVMLATKYLFMPSSWLGFKLTGSYILDHHSASQCTPMYDTESVDWYQPWVDVVAPGLNLPRLVWPGDIIGTVTEVASLLTLIPAGTPVIAGTIDAWAEAISVGAQSTGDLMLMYGTTMFLINTVGERQTSTVLWGTMGAYPDTYSLAGGMATSGAITGWLRELLGSASYLELLLEAERTPAGSHGVIVLPYFAGERTPIADPDARGVIAGLNLAHTRGDLYRAVLEATAFGVRHNIDALRHGGGDIRRIVAVGGGTQGGLWTQIVSDITGEEQQIPSVTIGASFGVAYLAACAIQKTEIEVWNPINSTVKPRREVELLYAEFYAIYLELYAATSDLMHRLSKFS